MTVSNVVNPLMVYFDRFLIGGRISMSAVAFYVTPYEVVTKLSMIPRSSPACSSQPSPPPRPRPPNGPPRSSTRESRAVFVVLFPAALVLAALAHPGSPSGWAGLRRERAHGCCSGSRRASS